MTGWRERRAAVERYRDERRDRIGTAIIRTALTGALITAGFVILNWGRVFGGDGTMSGEEFLSKVRCEPVAFVTQLGGAFGRLAPVDGEVVRYAAGGTRPRRHARVPARAAPPPPGARPATYTDCTFP